MGDWMTYDTLLTQKISEHVLLITLNRPEVRNAFNSTMMEEMHNLWLSIKNHSARCIILTGAGDKAFCAGADLKERKNLDEKSWRAQRKILQAAMMAMVDCPIPIIAAVNGSAYGGGLELVLASDFAYASTTASFGLPEVKVGLIPAAMGTQHLPRACGLPRAKEIIFTGEPFSAEEAFAYGIINRIVSPKDLIPETIKIAEKIAANAPLAVQAAKKSMRVSLGADISTAYQHEIDCYNPLISTHDRQEGITAFNEKRRPVFKGK